MHYLNANQAYPVIKDPNKTNGFLKNAFTRAVIIDNKTFSFNPELITDIPGAIDPNTYWNDTNADKNRKEPGRITYVSYLHAKKFDLPAEGIDILTKDSIKAELKMQACMRTTQAQHIY